MSPGGLTGGPVRVNSVMSLSRLTGESTPRDALKSVMGVAKTGLAESLVGGPNPAWLPGTV